MTEIVLRSHILSVHYLYYTIHLLLNSETDSSPHISLICLLVTFTNKRKVPTPKLPPI